MGIPMDSADNQLKEWIYNSRRANIEVNDKKLQVRSREMQENNTVKYVSNGYLSSKKINSLIV
jgi:hypothetical protein